MRQKGTETIMKLRYYMRGLGIGIIVTAILMGISLGGTKEKLDDEEIKERARLLGMVESTVLASPEDQAEDKEDGQNGMSRPDSGKPDETNPSDMGGIEKASGDLEDSSPSKTQSGTTEPEVTEPEIPEPGAAGPEVTEPDITEPGAAGPEVTEPEIPESGAAGPEDMVTITIERGESSVSVSRALEELGLVNDAKEYDRYLCSNGYDKSIAVGTYHIPVGSDEETIAKVITKKLSFE